MALGKDLGFIFWALGLAWVLSRGWASGCSCCMWQMAHPSSGGRWLGEQGPSRHPHTVWGRWGSAPSGGRAFRLCGGKEIARPSRAVGSVLSGCWGGGVPHSYAKPQRGVFSGCWLLGSLGQGVPQSFPGREKRQEGREAPGPSHAGCAGGWETRSWSRDGLPRVQVQSRMTQS